MIRKQIFLIFLFFLFTEKFFASEIDIIITVNDEIITNYDLEKEMNYLEILNPNLSKIEKEKKIFLSKNSLISEIIKKKELEKFTELKTNNQLAQEYLNNLFSKLGLDGPQSFEEKLKEKENYNLSEIEEKIKFELLWNEFIYSKYINQVVIDKDEIIAKVNLMMDKNEKEFLLSEIFFKKKKGISVQSLFQEITESINQIGFNNTANIYSNSESSKFGGQIGWIKEVSLSENIKKELNQINIGEITNLITIGNNFLILKIEDKRINKKKINKENEINNQINLELNNQLSKFSKIYFEKIKLNYSIDEK